MATYRIVSMDGGIGNNTAKVLKLISDELNARKQAGTIADAGFLGLTDLFAGTSAGGINSLFLADREDPDGDLDTLEQIWKLINVDLAAGLLPNRSINQALSNPVEFFGLFWSNLSQLVLQLTGFSSLLKNTHLLNLMLALFAGRPLGELKKKVCVVSFQLDNQDPADRKWTHRVFNNFGVPDKSDNTEPIVNVAMRTSALPIELPIFQSLDQTGPGFVDGALVANNPAVIALTELIWLLQKRQRAAVRLAGVAAADSPGAETSKVLMLSIGTGANLVGETRYVAPAFFGGSAPWGIQQWLLDLLQGRFLLLLQAVLAGGDSAVNFQADQLLQGNFFRVNPKVVATRLDLNQAKADAAVAADWLVASGWFPPPGTPRQIL